MFSPRSITPSQLTQDVEPGIGTTKSACHAPTDGFSMPTRFVCQFLISVLHMTTTETASLASKVTILRTDPVFSLHSTMLIPQIPAVEFGTGTIKFVFHAPKDGSSTPTRFVHPFLTNAPHTTTTVLASPVSRVTTSRMVLVFSPHSTVPSPLILDAVFGIGTIKFVFPAPTDGFSMPTRSVLQYQTNVHRMIVPETA